MTGNIFKKRFGRLCMKGYYNSVNIEEVIGQGVRVYNDPYWQEAIEYLTNCERCDKKFEEEDMAQSSLGDFCIPCHKTIIGRLYLLRKAGRKFCPALPQDYIFDKRNLNQYKSEYYSIPGREIKLSRFWYEKEIEKYRFLPRRFRKILKESIRAYFTNSGFPEINYRTYLRLLDNIKSLKVGKDDLESHYEQGKVKLVKINYPSKPNNLNTQIF